MEQELLTLLERPSSPRRFVGLVMLDLQFSVLCFVDRCLVFCPFHLAIVLSVLLRVTNSDYPFGIVKLFLNFGIQFGNTNTRQTKESHTDLSKPETHLRYSEGYIFADVQLSTIYRKPMKYSYK